MKLLRVLSQAIMATAIAVELKLASNDWKRDQPHPYVLIVKP